MRIRIQHPHELTLLERAKVEVAIEKIFVGQPIATILSDEGLSKTAIAIEAVLTEHRIPSISREDGMGHWHFYRHWFEPM